MSREPEPAAAEPLAYADAARELETILRELESGEVDIDRLTERVRRASELVQLCRGRLDEARLELTRIVAEIEPDEPSAATDGGDSRMPT